MPRRIVTFISRLALVATSGVTGAAATSTLRSAHPSAAVISVAQQAAAAAAARTAGDGHVEAASHSHTDEVSDPVGDVPDARGDIETTVASAFDVTAGAPAPAFEFKVTLSEALPPEDAAWDGDTAVAIVLDTDRNSEGDWLVFAAPGGVVVVDSQFNWVDCLSTFHTSDDGRDHHVKIDGRCIGSPSGFGFFAVMVFDADGISGNDDPQFDLAPDDGFSHLVIPQRGGVPQPAQGYWVAGSDGQIQNFGLAESGRSGAALNSPVVGMAGTKDFGGTWAVAADGGVFTSGTAEFLGSLGGLALNKPIVGMAATPFDDGYWLVASDGGVFAFGGAGFHGSTGGIVLNKPIVGMTSTATGEGYWLVASDGGMFAFGDASFFGSTGGIELNKPVVGMAATRNGAGYWLVASDGGVFAFGQAPFHGSTGGIVLNEPILGIARTRAGYGYTFVAADGGVFSFGDARFEGSAVGAMSAPVVAIAAA